MHRHGGIKVGVDASDNDSPLRQSAGTRLHIGFHDDSDSVSKVGKKGPSRRFLG